MTRILTAAALALSSSTALAHSGHGAPTVHTHEWEIGLAVVAAIAAVGFGLRYLSKSKDR